MPRFDGVDPFHGNTIFEYYTAALPRLKWLAQTHPHVLITDIDTTDHVINLALEQNLVDFACAGWSPTFSTAGTYSRIFLRLRELQKSGRSVCLVTGVDKPRIAWNPHTKQWLTFFQDVQFAWALEAGVLSGYQPRVEHFYFNRDVPQITVKQCHQLIKFLNPIFSGEDTRARLPYMYYVGPGGMVVMDTHAEWAKQVLYTTWNSRIYQAEKPTNVGQGDGPSWYLYNSGVLDSKVVDFARGQLRDWHDSIDKRVMFLDSQNRWRTWHYNTDYLPLSI
jgi:hypothetical protein